MTAADCHRKTGQPLRLCEAYVKAGLTVKHVTEQHVVDRLGLSHEEDKALEAHYRTVLETLPECSPGCPMCHKGLPRHLWD